MNKSILNLNEPTNEFTSFIMKKLKESNTFISSSNLSMAMKENIPIECQPRKGQFNKWIRCLYNIEIDESDQTMPYYKYSNNNTIVISNNNNVFIDTLIEKIKNNHKEWSIKIRLFKTTEQKELTWNSLHSIYSTVLKDINTLDQKFPKFSKKINKFRITKMPNKPKQYNNTLTISKTNTSIEFDNTNDSLGHSSPSSSVSSQFPPPPLSSPSCPPSPACPSSPSALSSPSCPPSPLFSSQSEPLSPPSFLPLPMVFPLSPQLSPNLLSTAHLPLNLFSPSEFDNTHISLGFNDNTFSRAPVPEFNNVNTSYQQQQNYQTTMKSLLDMPNISSFEDFLGLKKEKNKVIEIIYQLTHIELLFLDKIHNSLKNLEFSPLFKLINEIGKVRNIQFS